MKKTSIIAILESGNGFTKRVKLDSFVPKISIPFHYRIRVSDPTISSRFNLRCDSTGEFRCYKKTKNFAWYSLDNLGDVSNIKIEQ